MSVIIKPEAINSQWPRNIFGAIPKAPRILSQLELENLPQYSEKRMYGQGPGLPSFQLWFHIPPDGDPDVPALNILASILSGETGG